MAGNIQNVSFMSPQAMIAPDLSVDQQQVQRQSDLAAALRQMSMDPIDAGKGNIAWTQGMAKIAQAIAGRVVQNRADKKQKSLNEVMAQRMGSMFGQQGGGGQASGGGAPALPASIAPPAPVMSIPDAPGAGPSGAPQAPSPTMPQQGQGDPLAAAPPQEMPQQAPQQQGRGPWSLSGDRGHDMALYMSNPEEYSKALIANASKGAAPTDIEVMQQHLTKAVQDGDMGTAQAIIGAMRKANYTAPVNGRPGSTIRDPYDPTKIIGYDAPTQQGGIPVYDENGQFTGYKPATNAAAIEGQMAGAKAGATSAAQAPYDLVTVVDPTTGAQHQIPKSLLTGGGGASPSPLSPSGGGGTLGGFYNRPSGGGMPVTNQSGLGPQAQNAATTAGTNSANGFQQAMDDGAKAKDAARSLTLIMDAAKGLPTGPGSELVSNLKSGVNAAVGSFGAGPVFDPDKIAKFNEMAKNAANLGQQLSSGAGSTGTDARLAVALKSLPGSHYSPAAIQEVGLNLKGLAAAANARAMAASTWQQQNGPGSYAQFQGQWQKAYNPDLFYHMQKNDFQDWASKMSPAARAHTLDQYRTLKSLGAFQ